MRNFKRYISRHGSRFERFGIRSPHYARVIRSSRGGVRF